MSSKRSVHQLFTGPFPALERRFFESVLSRKRLDPLAPVEVLVGSNLLAVSLRRRYAAEHGAVANLRFLTFLDLARERVPADERPMLPALGAVRLAGLALGTSPLATAFGRLRERPSLARALVRTADDLRDAGVSPSVLPELLPRLRGSTDREPFLAALGQSLFRFEEMRRAFSDSTSLLERAAAASTLAQGEAADATVEPLFVFGVYDLGAVREALLRTLANGRAILAFVPAGSEVDESLFSNLLLVEPVRLGDDTDGKRAARSFVLAADDGSEAREVAREVLRAVDEGTPLHRIAILLREPSSQESAIAGELTRLAIPFFRPIATTLSRRPIGRAALLAVELAANDFRRETLLEFFDLFDALGLLPAVGLAGSSSASIVRTIETLGFGEGRARWPAMVARSERALRASARPGSEDAFENAAGDVRDDAEDAASVAHRERRLARLLRLRTAIDLLTNVIPVERPASWMVWADRLGNTFATLFGPHEDHSLLRDALTEISALEIVEPGAMISASEVLEAFQEALQLSPTTSGRFERDGVTLLSVIAARGLRFETVIIPGLVEKSFPASSRPDPLLSDDERLALSQAVHVSLPARSGARHSAEERFLFQLATQCAEKTLVFTAARRDSTQDRSRLLSPYLIEALEGILGRSLTMADLNDDALLGTLEARRTKLGRTSPIGPPLDEEELYRRVLDREPAQKSLIEASSFPLGRAFRRGRMRATPSFTEFEGLLSRPVSFLKPERPVSATRLERLAGCAYRAFMADVLHLEAREELDAPLFPDNLSLGILIHAALTEAARLLVLRGTSFADLSAVEAELLATRLAARHLDDWVAAIGIETYPVFLELSRTEVAGILSAFFAHERTRVDPLPLAGAEVRFGPRRSGTEEWNEDPNLSFDEAPNRVVGERSISFTGKIDRVDLAPGRVHVIDYKIGKPLPYGVKNVKHHLIAGGERSQLAVYAIAAEHFGAGEVSSEFLFVERPKPGVLPKVRALAFSAEQTRHAVDGLDQLLAGALKLAERGTFLPSTSSLRSTGSACDTCDFNPVCGAGHTLVLERKWNGDRAARGPGETIREMRRIP